MLQAKFRLYSVFVQVVLLLPICYSEIGYELHLVTHMISYQLWIKTSTISWILFCPQFDIVLFLFRDVPPEIIQHIFKQFVYLLKDTMRWYSKWNMSNHMLSEENTRSILMPSQDITLLLSPVISSCSDVISASFKHVY